MGEWFAVGQGIKTGLNRAFVVSGDRAAGLRAAGADLQRLARPRDLCRGRVEPGDRWLLRVLSGDEPNGLVLEWLESHRADLEARFQVRDGSVPWYALAVPQNLPLLEAPHKLLHPLYARAPRFALDVLGHHVLTGAYAIVPSAPLPVPLEEVGAWLNGPEVRAWALARTKLKRDGYREFGRRALLEVPVPWAR